MTETDNAALQAPDNADRGLQLIGSAFSAFAVAQTETAKAQAEGARVQAEHNLAMTRLQIDADLEKVRLRAAGDRLNAHQGFFVRVFGAFVLVGIIGGGFWTGHFELVTHALTVVAGGLAGYGLGRSSK